MVCCKTALVRAFGLLVLLALLLSPVTYAQPSSPEDGWPTRARTLGRTAYTPQDLPLDNSRLNLRWKRFLGERIEVEMEPIVVGDLLYIGLMNGKLYALDRRSGATVWVYDAGMGLTDSPTVADVAERRRIFFGSTNGSVYALDALTGEPVWVFPTGGPVMSTPSVYNGTVYIGSLDGTFYALDAVTGDVRWRHDTGAPVANTSAVGEEARPGQAGIFIANGDNVAFAFGEDGALWWQRQMDGLFTKRTYAVYANGVTMFVTRKPGVNYSEPIENRPSYLTWVRCLEFSYAGGQAQCVQPIERAYCDEWTYVTEGDQAGRPLRCERYQTTYRSGEEVVETWADYYIQYPRRRTLYFLDAATGDDLWRPAEAKTRFSPLYLPYWGEYLPVVDDQGYAWIPATSGGGDDSLNHDIRLFRLDLRSGEYVQAAHQDDFLIRFDEVGRITLAGTRYYQTASEDIGYYDIATGERNSDVYGNGASHLVSTLEIDEWEASGHQITVYGGMQKHFKRFGSSTPSGFGGANDAPSPLVVVGDEAYFTTWGHIYALTYRRPDPLIDYGALDLTGPPTTTLTREEARAMLTAQVQAIVDDDRPLDPVARLWGSAEIKFSVSFWHHGEVVRALAESIPYLDASVRRALKPYLKREVETRLLNPTYYEYRWACLDYESGTVEDPCDQQGVEVGWFWSNPNLTSERLYALYKYALYTDDWAVISANWAFIADLFNQIASHWDEEAGFLLFPEWIAGPFQPSLQMAAMLAMREMATRVGDAAVAERAAGLLNRMLEARVYWGKYVRSLYDTGQRQRQPMDDPETWFASLDFITPAEGYLDKDNEYRQIHSLERVDGSLRVSFDTFRLTVYPYYLIGYHPIYPEFSQNVRDNLLDELTDYLAAIETNWPWWYMSDYAHGAVYLGHEDESMSLILAADLFQARAYILNEPFDALAPYLPWAFENYGHRDIYRLENLMALLQAP